jgi:hypothetical protein
MGFFYTRTRGDSLHGGSYKLNDIPNQNLGIDKD